MASLAGTGAEFAVKVIDRALEHDPQQVRASPLPLRMPRLMAVTCEISRAWITEAQLPAGGRDLQPAAALRHDKPLAAASYCTLLLFPSRCEGGCQLTVSPRLGIIQLRQVVSEPSLHLLVIELCDGGELFEQVCNGALTEVTTHARPIVYSPGSVPFCLQLRGLTRTLR